MKVGIIGGGASGMVASIICARNGAEVVLFEKNEKLGKKLYITGKGRCNLTNLTNEQEFLEKVTTNSKFLRGAIYGFNCEKCVNFFNELGLRTKVERGNRVFPESDKSSDVIKVLQREMSNLGVEILLSTTVKRILTATNNDLITVNGVELENGDIVKCDKLIVATGGKSYSATGSTGDGYVFAKTLGHKVLEPKPSLVAIDIKDKSICNNSGLTLKNVDVSVFNNEKKICGEFGEMLITHNGVSGPTILSISSKIARMQCNGLRLVIDFKPAIDDQVLDRRLQSDFTKYQNKALKNAMKDLLPSGLIDIIIEKAQLDKEKKVNILTRIERQKLVFTLKNFDLEIKGLRGFEEAIITNGGICVGEINPKTMESKLAENVYFCGEVLDVDAVTGGYNLQIAFATAFLAGLACKE